LIREADVVKDWIEKWTTKIEEEVPNALKYVDQMNAVKYVESHMNHYVDKVIVINIIA